MLASDNAVRLGEAAAEFSDMSWGGLISGASIGLCGGVVRGVEEALSLRDRVLDSVSRADAAISLIDVFSDAVIVSATIKTLPMSDIDWLRERLSSAYVAGDGLVVTSFETISL